MIKNEVHWNICFPGQGGLALKIEVLKEKQT
jgi:hypothetical protein